MARTRFRVVLPRNATQMAALLARLETAFNTNTHPEVLGNPSDPPPFAGVQSSGITSKLNQRDAAAAVAEGCTTDLRTDVEDATNALRRIRDKAIGEYGDVARQKLAEMGFTVYHTPAAGSSEPGETAAAA